MSILAQVQARPELSLEEAIDVANNATFHAEMFLCDLPADSTWAQVWERLEIVDREFS